MTTGVLERETVETWMDEEEGRPGGGRGRARTHTITVVDQPDRTRQWRTDAATEIAAARAVFADLVGRGYFAYIETPRQLDGTTAAQVVAFTEEADITLLPAMVGG